jgi:hypothetical protein
MSDGAFGSIGNIFAPLPQAPPSPLASLPAGDDSSLEPEAALYLANHVAKVKLEAAESEYKWSNKVDSLRSRNRHLLHEVERLEKVVRENSLQWRLRERDDWKNLVTAVQRDRDRLEAENVKIMRTVSILKRQLQTAGLEPQELLASPVSGASSPITINENSTKATTITTTSTDEIIKPRNKTPHPDADNIPQATMMRFKELETQLAESLTREDHLRKKLQKCEGELLLWRVEKQADFDNTIQLLQRKLNLELEQKFMRNRGYRPLQSPSKIASSNGGRGGIISRMVEVLAPYPSVQDDYDNTELLNMAKECTKDEKL